METIEQRGARMARLWIRIALVYFVAGVVFGLYLAGTHNFQYAAVHAHVNLLGWASMALAGLIYDRFPRMGGNRLALTHFWLENLALPPAMVALFMLVDGNDAALPVVIISSLALALGVVVFAVNVWLNIGREPTRI